MLRTVNCWGLSFLLGLTFWLVSPTAVTAAPVGRMKINGKSVTPQQFRGAQLANEGMVLLRQNRNEEAAAKLREAVQLSPDLAEGYHNLGLALAKLGDTSGAMEALNKARSLKNIDATWLTMGGLYQANGQIDQAIGVYKEFMVRFPNNSMVLDGKLANLIKGLEKEKSNLALSTTSPGGVSAAQVTQAPEVHPEAVGTLGPGTGVSTRNGFDNAPTNVNASSPGSAPGSDYFAEVTRVAVLRWAPDRMPIKVQIMPGDRVPGFKSEYLGVLKQSFEDWSRASGGLITFDTTGSGKADLICDWVSNPAQLSNQAEAGETSLFGNKNVISSGKISILTTPLSAGLPVTRNSIRFIALHEIGHALGLSGHTQNPADIMFFSQSYKDQWRYLSPRDSKTITRLYSSP